MDTSAPLASIITQVNTNGEQVIVPPDHKDRVGEVTKKRPSLFSTLLCCIGVKASRLHKNKSNNPASKACDVKVSDDDGSSVNTEDGSSEKVAQDNGNIPCEPNHNQIKSPSSGPGGSVLLPPIQSVDMGKKCMVIDLDETLVHSSFKPISNPDFVVPVEIDGTVHQVYVLKRPYVDEYLWAMGQVYECVLFTASLAKYADPVADFLDKWGVFKARLFRESCVYFRGNYVKDLSKLGRDVSQILIVDNSPASYIFHRDNAVPITSWFDDMDDTELLDIIPFLAQLSTEKDIYSPLQQRFPNRT